MKALLIVVLTLVLTSCQNQPQQAKWPLPPGVKTMAVNGYEMAYAERGSGVPVVFVHGAGVDYRYYVAQMEPFSEKYRAISVSLRRYYPEPWRGEGDFSLNQHASDVAEFIRKLGAGPVHLVGHSRGATVALYATRAVPDLVRSLTIAEGGTSMKAFDADNPAARDPRTDWRPTLKEKLKAGDVDGALELFQTRVNGPGAWATTPEPIKQVLRENVWTLPAMFDDQLTWGPFSCDDSLRFNMPVLLVGADRSPPFFRVVLDNVQKCLTRSERAIVTNSSHSMPRLNPPGFTKEVLEFVSRH